MAPRGMPEHGRAPHLTSAGLSVPPSSPRLRCRTAAGPGRSGSPRTAPARRRRTLTIGAWLGRNRFWKIQIGSVWMLGAGGERGHDDLVEATARTPAGAPASSAERSIGSVISRNVREAAGAEVHRGLLEVAAEPPQAAPCTLLNTVTMQNVACAITIGEEAELDADDGAEDVGQRDAGDDAGQRDRQDDQQRDDVATEEAEPLQRQRGHRAEHQRDQRSRRVATWTDAQSASRAPWLCQAACHHSVV